MTTAYLTPAEVAVRLRVGRRWVYDLIARGRLACTQPAGFRGRRLIAESEVERLLAEGAQPTARSLLDAAMVRVRKPVTPRGREG